MRTGIGYDIHRLVEKKTLTLGGVEIPYKKGLLGHSDADVLLHAICDAILGAAGLGDIGTHFPDTDPKFKNARSTDLLARVNQLIGARGFRVNNVDSVVIAQEPKITPFSNKIKENIAEILNMDQSHIGVKATTNEGIGAIGEGEAIASFAVVTLNEK